MDFGAAIFFTDYSIGPAALGRALEERGFGSLWAPEHSHIPLSRSSPFPQGGELRRYRDAGVARLLFNLAPVKADEVLPVLDRCARLMRQGQS
jgi:hypothetical protein